MIWCGVVWCGVVWCGVMVFIGVKSGVVKKCKLVESVGRKKQ